MAFEVRKAGEADLDALAGLFDGYRQFYGQAPDVAGAREFLAARLANHESVVLVALHGDTAVGFVQLYPIFTSVGMQRVWLLNDLFVTEAARRNGVAEALMNAARVMAKADGAAGVLLETGLENHAAQALYEKLGYRRNDATCYYWLSLKQQ